MDSSKPEVVTEFLGIIRVYKDGHVERLIEAEFVLPSTHPETGVSSKDIIIILEPNVSARLFIPKPTYPNQKLPLLVYFHGGAFCVSSPFTPSTEITSTLWLLKLIQGPEAWLNDHADFERVFLGGESTGANIAHNLAIIAGDPEFGLNVLLLGIALVHPYFWGSKPIGSEALNPDGKAVVDRLWPFLCPANQDNNDPRVNPVSTDGPSLVGLGCRRVLVCVAEKDVLRDRGWRYYELWGQVGGWA
ncbi:hypothetical protein PVK06_008594 [Gossypium arboreum]|uniref:Alpha/beta hydrolase fold-3 domain-containing protein n=1 Tax=Gossypium arboreum TaxID=29729 RepID=A0ABR0QKA5_GOSAR|nr:hypothetical protein PVK06_008594 [Gossypium arboreum]